MNQASGGSLLVSFFVREFFAFPLFIIAHNRNSGNFPTNENRGSGSEKPRAFRPGAFLRASANSFQ
jgi:hypothetical protein